MKAVTYLKDTEIEIRAILSKKGQGVFIHIEDVELLMDEFAAAYHQDQIKSEIGFKNKLEKWNQ